MIRRIALVALLALGINAPAHAQTPHQWANNAESTLAVGINAAVTTLTVSSGQGARFPATGTGYYITVEAGPVAAPTAREIMLVTARSTDTLTVTRAQQSTSAASFSAGARVGLRPTAAAMDSLIDTGDAAGGSLSGTYPNPTIASGAVTTAEIANGTIVAADVNSANVDGAAGTASLRTLGTGASQAAAGNDSRLSDARTPTAHASTHLPGGSDALTVAAPSSVSTANSAGSAASFSRSDHVHAIAADAVGSSQIAADAVGSSEIATSAVGAAEIDTTASPQVAGLGVGVAGVAGGVALGTSNALSQPSGDNLRAWNGRRVGQNTLWTYDADTSAQGLTRGYGGRPFWYYPIAGSTTHSTTPSTPPASTFQGAPWQCIGTVSYPDTASGVDSALAQYGNFVSAASSRAYATIYSGNTTSGRGIVSRGSSTNEGGVYFRATVSPRTNTANSSCAFGVWAPVGGGTATPSTRDNGCGFFYEGSGTTGNWQVQCRTTGSVTPVDLGSSCPRSTSNVYRFELLIPTGSATWVGYRAYNITSGALCGEGRITTGLPTAGAQLVWETYCEAGSGASAQTLRVYELYGESGPGGY